MGAAIRRGYADAAAGQVHFVVCGEGPPLVLLGPAPRSWRAFEQMFPLLAADFRLVAPDVPGFGASPLLPPGAQMRDLAAGVVSVLDALGLDKAHVYGHNTGRLVAAAMAAEFPDRVDRLIIAGPTFTLVPEQETRIAAIRGFVADRYFGAEPAAVSPALREWAMTYRTMIGEWWWSDSLFTADPVPTIEALENRLIDELVARRTVREMYRINFEFDFAAALCRTPAKSLVIEIVGGSADTGGFSRQGDRLAAMMPDASAIVLEQTEGPIALFLLTGLAPMAAAIKEFLT